MPVCRRDRRQLPQRRHREGVGEQVERIVIVVAVAPPRVRETAIAHQIPIGIKIGIAAKGMNGHIAKPVDAEKVEKTICSVLGSQSEQ